MAAALTIVPAGAKQIAPGVFQERARRAASRAVSHPKKHPLAKRGKHGFWSRQWVWFAFALVLGEVAEELFFAGAPAWLSVPALILFAYGKTKNKPGAVNAAYAIQGMKLASALGITGTISGLLKQNMSGGGFLGLKLGSATPGPLNVQPASVGAPGSAGNTSTDVANAIALANALGVTNPAGGTTV